MPNMEYSTLEKRLSLNEASEIESEFFKLLKESNINDDLTKTFSEEFLPLLCLARYLNNVKSLCITKKYFSGHDGEIKLKNNSISFIQITCSSKSYNMALMKENMNNGNLGCPNMSYARNEDNTISDAGRMLTSPRGSLEKRKARVLEAIDKKESNFHKGTDTLLVVDAPSKFEHLKNLSKEISNKVINSKYQNIFITYGTQLEKIL